LGERLICIQEVRGSNPLGSTTYGLSTSGLLASKEADYIAAFFKNINWKVVAGRVK
jgi:hypothetical protein